MYTAFPGYSIFNASVAIHIPKLYNYASTVGIHYICNISLFFFWALIDMFRSL